MVENVQVRNGYILHFGKLIDGSLKIGDSVTLEIDAVDFNLLNKY